MAEAKDNRVEIFVPKGNVNDEPNQLVSVNGVNYLLPRGKKSKVPPEVAYEFKRAQEAQQAFDAKMDEMLAQSQEK